MVMKLILHAIIAGSVGGIAGFIWGLTCARVIAQAEIEKARNLATEQVVASARAQAAKANLS
jgi:membrane protein YqaA with SNARE-associated domain